MVSASYCFVVKLILDFGKTMFSIDIVIWTTPRGNLSYQFSKN